MSQNFELLNQLEAEIGIPTPFTKATTKTTVAETIASSPSSDQELISMAQATFFTARERAPRSVVFAGIDRISGSSQICLRLGKILAKLSDKPVCLIDGDLRSSTLTLAINSNRRIDVSFEDQERCVELERNLWLASGTILDPTGSGALAAAPHLRKIIEDLGAAFEYILIGAPGANASSEAGVLGQIADATVLVIEANSTRKAAALKAKKALESMDVRLLGTILNNRSFPVPEKLYRTL
jgi:Mrp family chromosome partitioning ATPase